MFKHLITPGGKLLDLNQLKEESLKKTYEEYKHLVPIIGSCLIPVGLVIFFLGLFVSIPYVSGFIIWLGFSTIILAGSGIFIFHNIIEPMFRERSSHMQGNRSQVKTAGWNNF